MQGVGRSSLKMSFSSRRARRLSRSAKPFVVAAEEWVTPATIAVEAATKFRRERMPVFDIGFSCSVIQNHTVNQSVVVGQFPTCAARSWWPRIAITQVAGAIHRGRERYETQRIR